MNQAPLDPGHRFPPLRVLLLSILTVFLWNCGSQEIADVPADASVLLTGRVADPSGDGVADADVTFTFHETIDCTSPSLRRSAFRVRDDGSFEVQAAAVEDVGPEFEPRDLCLRVRAEPPGDRPDLAPSDDQTFVVTVRRELGDDPLDEVEVNLTLPADSEAG